MKNQKKYVPILGLFAAMLLISALLVGALAVEVPDAAIQPEQIQLNEADCQLRLSAAEFVYDGTGKEPDVSVTWGSTVLEDGTDYVTSYRNNTQAGIGEVTITGIGNYAGTLSRTFTITCDTPQIQTVQNAVGGVRVKWSKTKGASVYCVFRKDRKGTWRKIGTTNQTSYLDQTARSGNKYTYTIRCGAQDGCTYVSGFNKSGMSIAHLSAPAIQKTEILDGGIRLKWTKVPGAVKYRVFRKQGIKWKKLKDVSATTYTDTAVKNRGKYAYTVRCISSNGKAFTSGYDNKGITVQYFAPPRLISAVNGQKGIVVRWKKMNGVNAYRIYRRGGSSGWKAVANVKGTSWTDTAVNAGQKYTYTVRCLSADGKRLVSSYNKQGVSTTRLTVPVLVSAKQSPSKAVVKWKAVKGASGYAVYRKTTGSGWKMLGQVKSLQYTDQTTDEKVDYLYTVRACRGSLLSGYNPMGIKAVHYDPMQQMLSKTETAQKTDQIVLVIDHNLTLWNKTATGTWKKAMDVYCGYGKNGLRLASSRHEGDMTTPIGAFPLTLAFGFGGNPGTDMEYRKITQNSYWSSEKNSTYNTWVESSSYVSGEHLMDYYQYKYAMAIGFNMDPVVKGRGSAIFLHCKSNDHWYTGGCVSVTEANMLKLMRSVGDGGYMIIVPNEKSLGYY